MSLLLLAYMIIAFAEDAAKTGKPRNTPAFGRLYYLVNADPAEGHSIDWFIDYNA